MATRDTLKLLVPAMATLADAVLDAWLALAVNQTNTEEWPALVYPVACCYLAGHLYLRAQLSAGGSGSGAGAVTSESAGGMSRSYGALGSATGADAELLTTGPGAEYVRLRKGNVAPVYALLMDETYALR